MPEMQPAFKGFLLEGGGKNMRIKHVYECTECDFIGALDDGYIQDSNPDVAMCPDCRADAWIVQPVTHKTLQDIKFTGCVRGEYFESEWFNGSEMCGMYGYGIYHVSDGVVEQYGRFCATDRCDPEDWEYAGDLIESFQEKGFEIIEEKT
jgi:hypothetical protein